MVCRGSLTSVLFTYAFPSSLPVPSKATVLSEQRRGHRPTSTTVRTENQSHQCGKKQLNHLVLHPGRACTCLPHLPGGADQAISRFTLAVVSVGEYGSIMIVESLGAFLHVRKRACSTAAAYSTGVLQEGSRKLIGQVIY